MPDLSQTPLPEGIVVDDSRASAVASIAFTEGPAAAADGKVYFSDIWNNRIMCFDAHSRKTTVWRADSGRSNGLLFDPEGRLLACEGSEFGPGGRRRITRTDMTTGQVEVLTDRIDGVQYNAPNDIAARSNGQIFFTDPCYGDRTEMQMTHESVYRIDPNGAVTRVITQPVIQRPNGIALSPDEQTLYVVDSCPTAGGHRKIWAFALSAAGVPSAQRLVYDFAPGRGGDGMAVDSEGNLYIAAGIDHPRPGDLNPAAVLAHAAALAGTEHAAHVDLGRRLREREEARAEARLRPRPPQGAGEQVQHALELRDLAHVVVTHHGWKRRRPDLHARKLR